MKICYLSSLLILVAGCLFGWLEHHRRPSLEHEYHETFATASTLRSFTDELNLGLKKKIRYRPSTLPRSTEARQLVEEISLMIKEQSDGATTRTEEEMPPPQEKLIARLLDIDPVMAKELLITLNDSDNEISEPHLKKPITSIILLTLGNSYPEEALSMLQELPKAFPKKDAQAMSSVVFEEWASRDSASALAWIKQHPEYLNERTKVAVISGTIAQEPAMAFRLMKEWGFSEQETSSSSQKIVASANTPERRMALVETLRKQMSGSSKNERDARRHVVKSLAGAVSRQGFESSIEWLKEVNLDGDEMNAFSNGVAERYSGDDSGRWLEWLASQFPHEERGPKISKLMGRWARQDFQAAGDWLNQLDDVNLKELAIVSFSREVSQYDQETAMAWALTLRNERERDSLLAEIQTLLRNDNPGEIK